MLRKGRKRSLNIKDPEAHRLAASIALATGESITRSVIEALRERLQRLTKRQTKAPAAELLAIARRISAQVKKPYLDHAELLYDEHGLPK